jgi:ATP-dependent Clp protease ATP-binding subunit ClpA
MENLIYPLYFKTIGNAVGGTLVGTGLNAIAHDLNALKAHFQEILNRNYKKLQQYPQPLFDKAGLKVISIEYRPLQKIEGSYLPISESLNLPINVVLGQKYKAMVYQAFLPDFDISFSYYDKRQLNSLLNAFLLKRLNEMSLREIHSLLFDQKNGLEILDLKIKENHKLKLIGFGDDIPKSQALLEKFAQKLPLKKKSSNLIKLPETAWGMEAKIGEMVDEILGKKRSVLVIGNSGSGKTRLITESIKKIQKNNVDKQSFWQMQIQRVTAKSKYLGEWQESIETLIKELRKDKGVLWLSDFYRLLDIGGESVEDSVGAFIRPIVAEGNLQLIGELSPSEYEALKRLMPNFIELFAIVEIAEPSSSETLEMLERFAAYTFENYKIKIESGSLSLTHSLLSRFVPYESFPGKAFKFFGQCFAEQKNQIGYTIDSATVIRNFSSISGLPQLFLNDELLLDTEAAHEFFASRIIGQPEAVQSLLSIVKIFKAGLNNPEKPIATLFFSGPSGVGKTSAANAIAEYFFGFGANKSALLKLDMSDFQSEMDIYRILGYADRSMGILNKIRDRPFSVLLLDEIEKADSRVFDLLLNILDEGRMTDTMGRVTDFRNTIIVMTSNLGSSTQKISLVAQDEKSDFENSLRSFFKAEFINRIDSFIHFKLLNRADIIEIARKEVAAIAQRTGFVKKGIKLNCSENLIEFLASSGFDERYGARPMQRAIEQKLIARLSGWLQSNSTFNNGTLLLDLDNDEISVIAQ